MKKLIYLGALLICTVAMAQEKAKEVKEETEVKTIRVKDNDKTTEKKVKVVTRETTNVELDENDKNKVNQDRITSPTKVEKLVMVDDGKDNRYDFLTKETYYVLGDQKCLFTPNDRGFDIAFGSDDESVKITKALTSSNQGYYIIGGGTHSGIGYYDSNGNFVVEYYNKDTNNVEMKTYKKFE